MRICLLRQSHHQRHIALSQTPTRFCNSRMYISSPAGTMLCKIFSIDFPCHRRSHLPHLPDRMFNLRQSLNFVKHLRLSMTGGLLSEAHLDRPLHRRNPRTKILPTSSMVTETSLRFSRQPRVTRRSAILASVLRLRLNPLWWDRARSRVFLLFLRLLPLRPR